MSTTTRPDVFVLIGPDSVTRGLAMLHQMADMTRELDGRRLGALLDLMADDVKTCAASKWRDRKGRKVTGFEFRATFTELPDSDLDIQISLTPVRQAA